MRILTNFKIDYYLSLIFCLIIVLYKADVFAPVFIIPILLISYYRIILKQDLVTVIILILSARLIMGPIMPRTPIAFTIFNLLCNYIPVLIILIYNFNTLKTINVQRINDLKWTILLVIFILVYSVLSIPYSISVFTLETLPVVLFLLLALCKAERKIDFNYLLKFFRYTFIACVIIYISPYFYEQTLHLFLDDIIFKDDISRIILRVARKIPRNTGFVFDFRIMGQLACLYLLVLYYTNNKNKYWDVILLSLVCILTFSRGPILILFLLFIGIYSPKTLKITKKGIILFFISIMLIFAAIIYSTQNETIQKFTHTFNPTAKNNAISQRGAFISYSLDKFYENPFGNGIGALSSSKADNEIFAGYTNLHKKVPDKVFYYKVGDAYLTMSLAEKGIIGFILLLLSLVEIFYSNKNRVSLFFTIGLFINLIGTDIPKQGFYYLVLLLVYYGLSQSNLIKLK